MAAPLPIDPADLIAGLGRGLAVIESFDDAHPRMTVAEMAMRTGIPRTAARRYLLSLCHFGYAATDGKRFWLRRACCGWARAISTRPPAAPGAAVHPAALDGHRRDGKRQRARRPRSACTSLAATARAWCPSVSMPALACRRMWSAPGIVLLSTFADNALVDWVSAHEFAGFTSSTVTDRAAFLRTGAAGAITGLLDHQRTDRCRPAPASRWR